MSKNYKILWLNGLLQGRTLHLPAGIFTIGPDGDILMNLVQATMVELLITDEGVALNNPLSGWINGVKQEAIYNLPLGQVIEMAGLAMILGLADEPLEIKPIPPHREEVKSRRIWLLGLSGVMTIVLVCLLVMIIALQTPLNNGPSKEQWVLKQFAQYPLSRVTHQWRADGTLELGGFCDDSKQLGNLLSSLAVQGIFYQVNTICMNQLIDNVRVVLEQNGFSDTQIIPGKEPATVVISGGITSGAQWDQVTDQLKNIKGLVDWQVVNNIDVQIKPLLERLHEKHLLSGLMITRVEDNIIITGKVSHEVQQQVMNIAKQIEKSTTGSLQTLFQNIPVQDKLDTILTGNIVSYGGNENDLFIDLDNGKRLTAGMKLKNGYVINSIDIDGVDLSNQGERIHIPLSI